MIADLASIEDRASKRGLPCLPVRGVMSILDMAEREVLDLIDDGRLPWAWDVALQPALAHKKALRVLPECVTDFAAGRKCDLEWRDVVNLLLPGDTELVLATQIERAMNVTETQISRLLRHDLLEAARAGRRGHGGSAAIYRNSFIRFLHRRRFPFPDFPDS